MQRSYFMQTKRIGFSVWTKKDDALALHLWGNPHVTRFICASGVFSSAEIQSRLQLEIQNRRDYRVQYWPIFSLGTQSLIGCCGLRPRAENEYEIGFHLLPEYWGQGYASEAAKAVVSFAFNTLGAQKLFAGHHPDNTPSRNVLIKLGFSYIGELPYAPTGLLHPSYALSYPFPSDT